MLHLLESLPHLFPVGSWSQRALLVMRGGLRLDGKRCRRGTNSHGTALSVACIIRALVLCSFTVNNAAVNKDAVVEEGGDLQSQHPSRGY